MTREQVEVIAGVRKAIMKACEARDVMGAEGGRPALRGPLLWALVGTLKGALWYLTSHAIADAREAYQPPTEEDD